ncbi:type IV toxin-antitoxin system AbiEi family antitoxin domain-containing protein [Roseateles noduli]|uniref:type IV toxin-antitoxin system AbiEi family antitoxin domain-containing protein n=1 Tax=Roseateles noduli TaxID=2052484 RepID=UPI003D64A801
MSALDLFVDQRLTVGEATFSREEAEQALGLTKAGLDAALVRLGKRGRIVNVHKGFYVVMRPEDRAYGIPDPAQWIGPLMAYLDLDYRVSLYRAAALHGSSHQAAMVFQVIVPRQLRSFEIGRSRIQFLTQGAEDFFAVNQADFLTTIKTRAGFAKAAGVELTLLDAARYSEKAGGINGVAQLVMTFGDKARSGRLAQLASHYETPCVRRLGFLFEHFHHDKQARALEPFAAGAKTTVLLDPVAKPVIPSLAEDFEKNAKWKLLLNQEVEIDL